MLHSSDQLKSRRTKKTSVPTDKKTPDDAGSDDGDPSVSAGGDVSVDEVA